VGVSHVTVMRVWQVAGLQADRFHHCMASRDLNSERKVKEILGLHPHPSEKAVVFCVDEKTAIQVLDRTRLAFPLCAEKPERHSVEYVRHGTVSLLAALEEGTDKLQSRCVERHTSVEFVRILEAVVDRGRKQIRLIVDNLSVHKTAAVRGIAGAPSARAVAFHSRLFLLAHIFN
jgi:hypothetical protein